MLRVHRHAISFWPTSWQHAQQWTNSRRSQSVCQTARYVRIKTTAAMRWRLSPGWTLSLRPIRPNLVFESRPAASARDGEVCGAPCTRRWKEATPLFWQAHFGSRTPPTSAPRTWKTSLWFPRTWMLIQWGTATSPFQRIRRGQPLSTPRETAVARHGVSVRWPGAKDGYSQTVLGGSTIVRREGRHPGPWRFIWRATGTDRVSCRLPL